MNNENAVLEDFELMEEVATETTDVAVEEKVEAKQKEEVKIEALNNNANDTVEAVVNTDQVAKDGLKKINQIGRELNQELFEREDEIRSIQLGLASGKHALLLGPPGTAKSMLAEGFAKHISNANYFQWLLNRTSDPSELLGPISIKAMENDQFIRKPEGKLPEAHIAFVDEIN